MAAVEASQPPPSDWLPEPMPVAGRPPRSGSVLRLQNALYAAAALGLIVAVCVGLWLLVRSDAGNGPGSVGPKVTRYLRQQGGGQDRLVVTYEDYAAGIGIVTRIGDDAAGRLEARTICGLLSARRFATDVDLIVVDEQDNKLAECG